ncbi:hypothetical protein WR25_09769 isoform B [Diploscapter pachys]|uniref:Clc-like protein n=1 Tax=Diploscapter pachys TaxID=2018661 RepID=A0A2A2K3C3_9BILA|nr:hypothetical protein WR25_09769 isoform A [Diploscapter pachys]PAV68435.1 hypothetical protein WR25_09769 isoform B [Diploscapter pachys]
MKLSKDRLYLQIPAIILTFIAFILVFVAIVTPAWQVAYARELRQWIQSGLWLSCQTSCTYTFTKDDFDFYTSAEVVNIRTPAFYQWQRTLLYFILLGQLFAVISLVFFCIGNMNYRGKYAAIGQTILLAIATLIICGCMLTFMVFSFMVQYRFYHVSVSGIYEKHIGYSYFIAVCGAIIYLIATIFSLVYAVKQFREDRWASGGSLQTFNTQVAYDLDVNTRVDSGLWLYCPGNTQSWHYTVLYMNIVVMAMLGISFLAAIVAYFKPAYIRKATIVLDIFLPIAGLLLAISLGIFMANAEMLESKYLIGHKRAFEVNYNIKLDNISYYFRKSSAIHFI